MKLVENKANSVLDKKAPLGTHLHPMAHKQKRPEKITMRPTDEDLTYLGVLKKYFGVDQTAVIRIALRRLAQSENLQVAS